MDEKRLYETIGRQQVRIDQLAADNAALLALLGRLKDGSEDIRYVFVQGDQVTIFRPPVGEVMAPASTAAAEASDNHRDEASQ